MINILFSLLLSANAQPIRIAVIDTGFNMLLDNVKICSWGNIDLTGKGFDSVDGHGNNITSIITQDLKDVDYCIHIIKFYHDDNSIFTLDKALNYAYSIHPDIVNISAGGPGKIKGELSAVQGLLNNHTIIVAAAGNDNQNLDENCYYYPACYDNRILTVGSTDNNNKKSSFSNYGKYVKIWEQGEKVSAGGSTFSGTSQATARITGLIVKEIYERKRKIEPKTK